MRKPDRVLFCITIVIFYTLVYQRLGESLTLILTHVPRDT